MIPIETVYQTGSTLYAVIHNPDGTVWNTTLNTGAGGWEAFNSAHWSQYAISLTEQSPTGYYRGTYPTAITGVLTTEAVYVQLGGSPATSDSVTGLAQTQGANMAAVGGDVTAAINMSISGGELVQGAAVTGTLSKTQASTNLSASLINAYTNRTILWTSGVLAGVAAGITGYAVTNGVLTFTPVPAVPEDGSTFLII